MSIRIITSIFIIFVWVYLINIANNYEYLDYLKIEIYPYDVEYPWKLKDYLLNYIDYLFLFFIEKQLFIKIIYAFMGFSILLQLYVFILNKDNVDEAIGFNLNVPPLLGVIGTIYAFAYFIALEQNINDIIKILKENFNSAAMTTIIGGITYTVNYVVLVINEYFNKFSDKKI